MDDRIYLTRQVSGPPNEWTLLYFRALFGSSLSHDFFPRIRFSPLASPALPGADLLLLLQYPLFAPTGGGRESPAFQRRCPLTQQCHSPSRAGRVSHTESLRRPSQALR